jgi:tRNA A37 threonylcarbamoyladenosine biosynthesis protein TsaE
LHHLDLYRLSRGVDVELFAWDDYLGPDAITFVEWPAAGSDALPPADLRVELEHRTRNSRTARLSGVATLEAAITAGAAEAGLSVAVASAAPEDAP